MTYSIKQPLFPGDVVIQVVEHLPFSAFSTDPYSRIGARFNVVAGGEDHHVTLEIPGSDPKAWGYYTQVIRSHHPAWAEGASDPLAHEVIRLAIDTPEQAFSAAARHMVLVLKGRRNVRGSGAHPNQCMYRGPQGACAVGALLSDTAARSADGGECALVACELPADALWPYGTPGNVEAIQDVLTDLQYLHDMGVINMVAPTPKGYRDLTPGRRLHGWKRTLRRYAKRQGFAVPEWLQAGGKE